MKSLKAFTMIEMMITLIIMIVIAGYAVPSYNRSQERADERVMITNLRIISSALETYRNRNGDYPIFVDEDLEELNRVLNLSIMAQGVDYYCEVEDLGEYDCDADSPYGWEVEINDNRNNGDPYCDGGVCPSCDGNGCPM